MSNLAEKRSLLESVGVSPSPEFNENEVKIKEFCDAKGLGY